MPELTQREKDLREITMIEVRKSIGQRNFAEAMGVLLSMCSLPEKISSLVSWINKPYCSTYNGETEVIRTQIDTLEETRQYLPLVQELIDMQLHNRRKALMFLEKPEKETLEA